MTLGSIENGLKSGRISHTPGLNILQCQVEILSLSPLYQSINYKINERTLKI